MLSPSSQVLIRNSEIFEQGIWGIVNPEDTFIFAELPQVKFGFHHFYDVFQASPKQLDQQFGASFSLPDDTPKLDGAIVYMPKAKQVLDMLIHNLNNVVKPEGRIILVGENKSGAKSAAKLLQKHLDQVHKIDAAKHCSLFSGFLPKSMKDFSIDNYLQINSIDINEVSLQICSLPGVFGHKKLDEGTALLLSQYSDHKAIRMMKGNLYDFACGTGVIGCYFQKVNPALEITFSELSALALYCCEKTLDVNHLNGKVIASDGMQEITGTFNYILSNPPFHSGIKNDYAITEKFIKDAYKHLKSNASLSIVANRFLPYPDLLEDNFGRFEVLEKTNKYTVYRGVKS
ncbi:methyltransferase [Glaciecola sp. 1036]|uniref:methyltransferase n=1 Tax=Alteromonadaceae TaxID=72275 RepID=UPI003CFFFAE7